MLVEKGKIETAKIKVENSKTAPCRFFSFLLLVVPMTNVISRLVINEDIYIELLELLELYCELLLARFGLLDQKYVQQPFFFYLSE